MRLWGLLLTLSLVRAEEYDSDIYDPCVEENTTVPLQNTCETLINSSLSELQCFIYNENLLSCSWGLDSLPEDAQYSASFQYLDIPGNNPLKCIADSPKKLLKCQSRIQSNDMVAVKVNISINGYWCIMCNDYDPVEIEKLDPPQNITTSIKSTNLEIQWEQPRSCCSSESKCFMYQLKIDNELVKVEGVPAYNKTNFEPTRSYNIQIRTKVDTVCGNKHHWSDWSKEVVVRSSENVYQLNAFVIATIAFVLPMILLAFLLVCKFQRLFEKLFPSIPNPSKNVQMLLEKNDFNQVKPAKQSEEGVEVIAVIYSDIF